ncbi:MAG: phytanoyl-CoA dioxygenase family protein [Planctomycetes bacterium]|nr:phytanoyl-CoA dioxygenase family protein [Planctomycetota bacterium]
MPSLIEQGKSPAEILASLRANADLFMSVYRHLEDRNLEQPVLRQRSFPSAIEAKVESTAAALERDGIAIWPGFITDPELIEELRCIVYRAQIRSQRLFATAADDELRVVDEALGWEYCRGGPAARAGIARVDFWPDRCRVPEAVARVWRDARPAEVIGRAYRVPTRPSHVIGERVFRDPRGDLVGWHVDRIMDQAKVMILLDDVDELNAPFRYRPGTHRALEEKKLLLHHYFSHGIFHCEVTAQNAMAIGTETRVCTGRAGDAVFFDTGGIHSRSVCYEGAREVLNLNFSDLPTAKNRFFEAIRGDAWF